MIPPRLAPSTALPIRASVSTPRIPLTDSDWTTLYPEIERLYVRERRKLRYITQYIEAKYGLKATQQMYKKRFAKWRMQKNPRRSAKSEPSCTPAQSNDSSSPGNLCSVPVSPQLGVNDSLMLSLLISVRTWNISFYESAKSNREASRSLQHSWPERYHDMNFTFKLMIDMLSRGHGDLAGRVARKAFLLAEETLMLEGPTLLWNTLEIMHFMIKSHHSQLFQLLLAHMRALIDLRMPRSHPLPTILRVLGALIADSPSSTFELRNKLLTSSPRPATVDVQERVITTKTLPPFDMLLSMIEQSWKLNAEILFQKFHHRLFQLYLRIHWDTCSIEPPNAIFAATRQWLARVTPQQKSCTNEGIDQCEDYIQTTPFDQDGMLQSLLMAPTDSVLPKNYEIQRMDSIKMLQDHAVSILSREKSLTGESGILLRILASLVTAKVLKEWCATPQGLGMDREMTLTSSRGQAGNTACALRTTMYLNVGKHGIETYLDTAGQIRSILALREYAKSGTDPRIVREMWLLGDVLVAAGEHQKASEVKQAAFHCLEQYIQDIDLNPV